MSLQRRWIATCDEPWCEALLICPNPNDLIYGDDKGNAGISAVDAGWDAIPSSSLTYCPRHSRYRDSIFEDGAP